MKTETPTADPFKDWLKTDEGKECLRIPVMAERYLENRLWYAFMAGGKNASIKTKALEEEIKELLEALKDATGRMDRCRMILVERDGQPDCWQILHTSHAKVAMLKHTPPVGVETK